MTKERYKEIRNKRTFLYLYFIETSGSNMPESQFSVVFSMWLSRFGAAHDALMRKIIAFLDKKFV